MPFKTHTRLKTTARALPRAERWQRKGSGGALALSGEAVTFLDFCSTLQPVLSLSKEDKVEKKNTYNNFS